MTSVRSKDAAIAQRPSGPAAACIRVHDERAFVRLLLRGEMGAGLLYNDYPLLAPSRSAVTKFFVELYSSDRFITVGVLADVCALVWLVALAFGR